MKQFLKYLLFGAVLPWAVIIIICTDGPKAISSQVEKNRADSLYALDMAAKRTELRDCFGDASVNRFNHFIREKR